MTEMLKKEFSRKTFLKGGGALVVGFSVAGSGLVPGKAQAATPGAYGPADAAQIDSYITVHADNTVSVYGGKMEIGQGVATGILMMAGEELDVAMSQMRYLKPDSSGGGADTGNTTGSNGISGGGVMVRGAAAEARRVLLNLASASLAVPVASLTVHEGVVSGGGKSVKYGDLLGDKLFSTSIKTGSAAAPLKPPSQYKLVGTSPPRIDIPDKVTGAHVYMHNVRVPGMLHGRLVLPRGQGAYGTGAKLLSIDKSSIRSIPGAQVVRRGDLVGVVAAEEYDAIQAAAQLKVTWQDDPKLSGNANIVGWMRAQDSAGLITNRATTTGGNVDTALASAAKVVSASYTYEYQNHGPIGPSVAIASVTPSSATILTNTQGVFRLRGQYLARILGMDEKKIRVQYFEGASSFGHCETDDAACAAAVMSQIAGKPVRLQFMRWDEHGWDNFGPTQLTDVRAGIDATGKIVAYDNYVYVLAQTHAQETAHELVGLGPLTAQQLPAGTGSTGPSVYTIANRRGTGKSVQVLNGGYFKTAPLRAPSSPTNFPAEQMIDELAHAANMDPIAFRLKNTTAARTIAALQTVAQISNWQPKVAASNLSKANVVTGRGVATAGTGAVVVDIEVNKKTGKITAKHMYGVQDVGLAVSPGLVENQIVGSLVHTASRALLEGVRYNKTRVTGLDWVTYPIMRFKDHPSVTTVVLQRIDLPPDGAGEPLVPGTPAAIANAFFDATGVRIRHVPMTPAVVRATLQAAGVK